MVEVVDVLFGGNISAGGGSSVHGISSVCGGGGSSSRILSPSLSAASSTCSVVSLAETFRPHFPSSSPTIDLQLSLDPCTL